jgi:hypothetical protein
MLYNNSVQDAGFNNSAIIRRIQKAMARLLLVFVRATTSDQQPTTQLHYSLLPITSRIKFITAILMCLVRTNHSPSHISQALSTAASIVFHVSRSVPPVVLTMQGVYILTQLLTIQYHEPALNLANLPSVFPDLLYGTVFQSHCDLHPALTF